MLHSSGLVTVEGCVRVKLDPKSKLDVTNAAIDNPYWALDGGVSPAYTSVSEKRIGSLLDCRVDFDWSKMCLFERQCSFDYGPSSSRELAGSKSRQV